MIPVSLTVEQTIRSVEDRIAKKCSSISCLQDREKEFISSIRSKIDSGYPLTTKQFDYYASIIKKLGSRIDLKCYNAVLNPQFEKPLAKSTYSRKKAELVDKNIVCLDFNYDKDMIVNLKSIFNTQLKYNYKKKIYLIKVTSSNIELLKNFLLENSFYVDEGLELFIDKNIEYMENEKSKLVMRLTEDNIIASCINNAKLCEILMEFEYEDNV